MATRTSVMEAFQTALATSKVILSAVALATLESTLIADFARSASNRVSETQKVVDGETLYRCSKTGLFLPLIMIVVSKNISYIAQSWVSRRGTILKNAESASGKFMVDGSKTIEERMAKAPLFQEELNKIKEETENGIEGVDGMLKALNVYIEDNSKYKFDKECEALRRLLKDAKTKGLEVEDITTENLKAYISEIADKDAPLMPIIPNDTEASTAPVAPTADSENFADDEDII